MSPHTADDPRVRRSSRRRSHLPAWIAAPATTLLAALALGGPADAAITTPTAVTSGASLTSFGDTSQGLIMRDGGICDPIRHIGC
jgi:hypothetical protein